MEDIYNTGAAVYGSERRRKMGASVKNNLSLSQNALNSIAQRMAELADSGVKVNEEHSGELNFAGCASGYCQAWD